MTRSIIKSIKPVGTFYADVVSFATQGYYAFDADDWADAQPKRKTAKAITVETDFTYAIHNKPDYKAEVGYRFLGDFSKSGGVWTGTVDRLQFLRDGEVVGLVVLNSEVDVSRVMGVGGSGLIWNELTVTGLKGAFSRAADIVNGSLGDDVIDLGRGNDQINASRGNDLVRGGAGRDLIDGFDGNDRLFGGGGADRLIGNGGDDRLFGQGGGDTFQSDGQGANVWTGGKGGDFFQVSGLDWDKSSPTTVADFSARQGDRLDLREFSPLLYNEVDAIRYIGGEAFSASEGVAEIRMEAGLVTLDADGDGIADHGLLLEGLGAFDAARTGWIVLPEPWEFG
ncbi:calcium-binding protein [Albimonas pacifica]|nr:calcium-binding protein [Albimonas pacifica]